MAGVYGAVAQGLESGFNLGLRSDAAIEEKRARKVQEERQVKTDARAEEEFGLRKQIHTDTLARQAVHDQRLADVDTLNALTQRQASVKNKMAGLLEAAGGDVTKVDPSRASVLQAEADEVQRTLDAHNESRYKSVVDKTRQQALDLASKLEAGQVDINTVPGGDLVRAVTASTRRNVGDFMRVDGQPSRIDQAANDIATGMQTKNEGMLLRGANTLLGPELKVGVGQPSPHGGTIVGKEIIKLVPHPQDASKFTPVIRVFVKKDGGQGGGGRSDGATGHYDAPLTQNRSTDPNDTVKFIDMGEAMDRLGRLQTLGQALNRPDLAKKVTDGAKEAGADPGTFLESFYALGGKMPGKTVSRERMDLGGTVKERTLDAHGRVIKEEDFQKTAVPRVFNPNVGRGRGGSGGGSARGVLQAKLDTLEEDLADGVIDAEEYREQRRAIVSGIKPAKGGAGTSKGLSNAELNSTEQGALDSVATKLGLSYDKTAKAFRNTDGTSMTAAQKSQVDNAQAAIRTASRDAAAKGERTGATPLVEAGTAAAKPSPAAKFKVGDVVTNAKGQKAKFGGVDADGKNIWLAP